MTLTERVQSARLRREHFEFNGTWESMEEYYVTLIQEFAPSSEHLPTLRRLSWDCNYVVELGTQHGNSAFSMLMASPCEMQCVDVRPCKYIDHLLQLTACTGTEFEFVQADSRGSDGIMVDIDLLFVDSDHTYDHCKAELQAHKAQCRRYVVFHDTVSFPGILPAIEEELTDFDLVENYTNGHGLQVWERR